jgi:hypothetical protein
MKVLDFFLFLWVIFALLDPDLDLATQINADPCGSGSETLDPDVNLQSETGSTDPIEPGSEPDSYPDPTSRTGENHKMFTDLSEYRCVRYR